MNQTRTAVLIIGAIREQDTIAIKHPLTVKTDGRKRTKPEQRFSYMGATRDQDTKALKDPLAVQTDGRK